MSRFRCRLQLIRPGQVDAGAPGLRKLRGGVRGWPHGHTPTVAHNLPSLGTSAAGAAGPAARQVDHLLLPPREVEGGLFSRQW